MLSLHCICWYFPPLLLFIAHGWRCRRVTWVITFTNKTTPKLCEKQYQDSFHEDRSKHTARNIHPNYKDNSQISVFRKEPLYFKVLKSAWLEFLILIRYLENFHFTYHWGWKPQNRRPEIIVTLIDHGNDLSGSLVSVMWTGGIENKSCVQYWYLTVFYTMYRWGICVTWWVGERSWSCCRVKHRSRCSTCTWHSSIRRSLLVSHCFTTCMQIFFQS